MPRKNPNQRERGQGARLSKRTLDTLGPGRHTDGPHGRGLMFNVKPTGARSWLQRLTVGGRRRLVGLGPYPEVSLEEARDMAIDNNRTRLKGRDPFAERRRARSVPTFAECRDAYLAFHSTKWKPGSRNEQNFRSTLAHARALDTMPVDTIGIEDVHAVIAGLLSAKMGPTARSARQRIRSVLDWATGQGHRHGENPAASGVLDSIMPRNDHRTEHQARVDWEGVAAVLAAAGAVDAPAWAGMKGAFRFCVLTAARTSEVLGMRWSEVDLEAATWTVPAARMKAGREHRVPLSKAALEILHAAGERTGGEGLVFRGPRRGQIDGGGLRRVLKRAGYDHATVHGFRSCFRDWAVDRDVPDRQAEFSLAHVEGKATVAAYQRDDLLEKRRPVMERWARHCTEPEPAKVVAIR